MTTRFKAAGATLILLALTACSTPTGAAAPETVILTETPATVFVTEAGETITESTTPPATVPQVCLDAISEARALNGISADQMSATQTLLEQFGGIVQAVYERDVAGIDKGTEQVKDFAEATTKNAERIRGNDFASKAAACEEAGGR